jgi:hypothetical protein
MEKMRRICRSSTFFFYLPATTTIFIQKYEVFESKYIIVCFFLSSSPLKMTLYCNITVQKEREYVLARDAAKF